MRILVVDDYRPFAVSLERLLAAEHRVVIAQGGQAALALLAEDRDFDLLLVDLDMPDVTGVEVLAALQERWPVLAPRLVFMTGGVRDPIVGDALRVVGNTSIEKPFEQGALQELLARFGAGR